MYLIPKNVNTRFEFRDGFGWKELGIMLIGGGTGTLLFYLLGLLSVEFVGRLILLALPIYGAFYLIQPHPLTKISVLDTLRLQIRFTRSKKRYLYVYGGDRS
ncbi:hypothetical protein O3V59_21805 [Brevibacillus thermoruber]|jgi:hypothetical protein|uniref:PrgI family protein n=1 Tax=Brevibacillus thermoruber TaxID=33942 RepID=A0A9X3Z5L2_9BACL|nr:hypothetical protein [Brevibacillus thermoruber]MDA5110973.1 hypothetical protein [Brevibacillus thermoruber]